MVVGAQPRRAVQHEPVHEKSDQQCSSKDDQSLERRVLRAARQHFREKSRLLLERIHKLRFKNPTI